MKAMTTIEEVRQLRDVVVTDQQWEKIRASLEVVGVNADTIVFLVVAPPDETRFWVYPDEFDSRAPEKPREYVRLLRAHLPAIAYRCCARADFPKTTPKQLAAELTPIIKSCDHLLTQCKSLLTRLDSDDPPDYRASARTVETSLGTLSLSRDPLCDRVSRMTDRLETFAAELERWRDELPETDNKGNRSTAHNLFWKDLVDIWTANVGRDVKWRDKHLANFLIACSEPFFPKEATDGAINAFVER